MTISFIDTVIIHFTLIYFIQKNLLMLCLHPPGSVYRWAPQCLATALTVNVTQPRVT